MDASLSRLVLFAETPRGGPHGHRVLVPAEAQVPQPLLAEFLAAVQGDMVKGANFVGVSRAASQKIGTAVRQGREVLVLAGVDVTQLSGAKQKDLEQRLRELLEQLDDMVLRGVDWSHHPSSEIVIRRAEMGEWLKELETRLSLPTRPWQEGPVLLEAQGAGSTKGLSTLSGGKTLWPACRWAATLLVVVGLSVVILNRPDNEGKKDSPPPSLPNSSSPPKTQPRRSSPQPSVQADDAVEHRMPEQARKQNPKQFQKQYDQLMHHQNLVEAAEFLVTRLPPEPELENLKQHYRANAPEILRKKVQDALSQRSYLKARETVAICDHPHVVELLSAADLEALRQLSPEIDEREDQDLYAQILEHRPQCADQVNSYLTKAPLKTMQRHVEAYRQWLHKMESPMDLTLELKSLEGDNVHDPSARPPRSETNPSGEGSIPRYPPSTTEITVSVRGESFSITRVFEQYPHQQSAPLKFRAKLDDKIQLDVHVSTEITEKGTLRFLRKTKPPQSSKNHWTGTIDELRSTGLTIDLPGQGFANKATFSLSGIPPEPELPQWTRP